LIRTTHHPGRRSPGGGTGREAFTVIEMVVVIAIIGLLAAIVVPSAVALFSAGAEQQALNIVSTQLMAARAEAIRSSTYCAVHFQPVDPDAPGMAGLEGVSFSAVMWIDPGDPAAERFTLHPNYTPRRLPGLVAIGQVDPNENFLDAAGEYRELDGALLEDFTTSTVVFSPTGQLVRQVPFGDDGSILFNTGDPAFSGDGRIWDAELANDGTSGEGELGQYALTVADLAVLLPATAEQRARVLNESGIFLPISPVTGQLLPRE
jgi:prepilin-type N-terminal cleavage/methylation domain-containing protein